MDGGLVGVIVGGLIAIASGIAITLVQHYLGKADREEQAKKADIQSLIIALYELDDWLERYKQAIAFGKEVHIGVSPLGRVEGLVLTNFPEVRVELASLRSAVADHVVWASERMTERVSGKPPTIGEYTKVTRAFSVSRSNLIGAVTAGGKFVMNPETLEITYVP